MIRMILKIIRKDKRLKDEIYLFAKQHFSRLRLCLS